MNLIPNHIREKVIQLWLRGEVRKEIAVTCGIGEGTVTNIVDDWKRNLGNEDADALRELAVSLKRSGIDALQCAEGFRILNIMKKLGVNKNHFKSFIREVYQYCQRFGLTAEEIASNLQPLVNLSKEIPFAKIPDYIEEKKKEIARLDGEIRKLKEDIKILERTKEDLKIEISTAKELVRQLYSKNRQLMLKFQHSQI